MITMKRKKRGHVTSKALKYAAIKIKRRWPRKEPFLALLVTTAAKIVPPHVGQPMVNVLAIKMWRDLIQTLVLVALDLQSFQLP